MAWKLHAIEQTQLRRHHRVEGVGRLKFDFHTGLDGGAVLSAGTQGSRHGGGLSSLGTDPRVGILGYHGLPGGDRVRLSCLALVRVSLVAAACVCGL